MKPAEMTLVELLEHTAAFYDDCVASNGRTITMRAGPAALAKAAELRARAERLREAFKYRGSGPGEGEHIAGWHDALNHINAPTREASEDAKESESCTCRVPGIGNGDSKCRAPMRAVCRCACHTPPETPGRGTPTKEPG